MDQSHNSQSLNNPFQYENETKQSEADVSKAAEAFVPTKEQWRIQFSILFSTMTVRTLIYVVAIFLPLYVEANHETITAAQVGLIIGAVTLTNAILCIPTGFLLFYISHKTLALTGQGIVVLACFVFALTTFIQNDTTFFYVCYISRLLIGIGTAIYNVSSLAILTIEFEEIRSKILFEYVKWEGFGILAGPIFGGILYIPLGFAGAVFGVALINVFAFTLSVCWLPARINEFREIQNRRAEEKKAAEQADSIANDGNAEQAQVGFTTFFTSKRALNGLVSAMIAVFFATFLDGILSVELENRDQPLYGIILAFMSTTISYIITIKVLGAFVHRVGARRFTMLGFMLYVISLSCLGPSAVFHYPANATWLIYLGMCVHGSAFAMVSCSTMPEIYYGAEQKVISKRQELGLQEDPQTSIDINSVGATLLLTFKCMGVAFAPFIGGSLTDKNGYQSACDIVMFICMGYCVWYLLIAFCLCSQTTENFQHDSYGLNKEELAIQRAKAGKGNTENAPLLVKK